MTVRRTNTKLLWGMIAFVLVMISVSYASVPLYRLFCQATGFGGTTQRVLSENAQKEGASAAKNERTVNVSFDANVDQSLPWEFAPDVKSVRVKIGEVTTIKYHAINHGTKAIVGTARYNVQPDRAGAYFEKIQCFCFTEQALKPGEEVSLPVQFYVDESLVNDPQNDDIHDITLSYTFFLSKDQSKAANVNMTSLNSIPRPSANP